MNKFEKHIREKLQKLECEPPDNMWSRIEERLDPKTVGQRFIWHRVAAAVAIFLVAIYSSLLYLPGLFDDRQETAGISQEDSIISPQYAHGGQAPHQAIEKPLIIEEFKVNNHVDTDFYAYNIVPENGENGLGSQPLYVYQADAGKRPINRREGHRGLLVPLGAGTIYSGAKPLLANAPKTLNITFGSAQSGQSIDILTYVGNQLYLSGHDNNYSGLTLSAFIGPQSSFRYQSRSSDLAYEPVESQLKSMSFGINLYYRINPVISIQSGLAFSRWGQRIHNIAIYQCPAQSQLFTFRGQPTARHPQSMVTSMGAILFTDQSYYFADASSSRVFTLKGSFDQTDIGVLQKAGLGLLQQLDFLQIPLLLNVRLFEHRLVSVSAKAGISANIFRTGRVLLDGTKSSVVLGNTVVVSNYNIAGTMGVVFGFPVSNRVNLLVEPTFSMFINTLGENYNISGNTHPYSNSVLFGLSYDL